MAIDETGRLTARRDRASALSRAELKLGPYGEGLAAGRPSDMRHNEFRKRLDRLHEVLLRGLAYYTVWKRLRFHDPSKVSWSLEEQNEVLGRFRGFITPVAQALHDMALMEFAKMFDTDPRTASLRNLLSAARQDPTLVPRASAGDVDKASAQFRHSKRILTALERKRNQQLAHVDVEPLPVGPIRNTELDNLAEDVKSTFNFLSTAHDGRAVSWEYSLQTADRDTRAILRILREEIGRVQKEYEEEMVRIVLEEIRREQVLIGRRLNSEELRSKKQSFGVTDEQMQRIEEQYGSS